MYFFDDYEFEDLGDVFMSLYLIMMVLIPILGFVAVSSKKKSHA